ncbi:hypothetical protein EJ04DRAFT_523683 [Polyplosphaeria fusca]|uniref:Uncharacterized protein n=1 Tax=Polyplosphaeria fusca TaxID=682080 RepID=A0A9P4V1D7_9PLEO|nr:hypothetical protein EJ04DRAFT_523683 [Polyplosphaeria fusca]
MRVWTCLLRRTEHSRALLVVPEFCKLGFIFAWRIAGALKMKKKFALQKSLRAMLGSRKLGSKHDVGPHVQVAQSGTPNLSPPIPSLHVNGPNKTSVRPSANLLSSLFLTQLEGLVLPWARRAVDHVAISWLIRRALSQGCSASGAVKRIGKTEWERNGSSAGTCSSTSRANANCKCLRHSPSSEQRTGSCVHDGVRELS